MRRAIALALGSMLVAAACGSDSDERGETAPPATDAAEVTDAPQPTDGAAPAPTDAPDPPPTDAPDPPPTEPPPTDPPQAATTTEPPPPLRVVGLVPLPGQQFDFTAQPVPNPSLVWSLYSGSGGIIVENVGGPLPPGCHGTSFFDPVTFDLLQIDGIDADAYATRGEGGCDGMQQDVEDGVVDGEAVKTNTDDLIVFDFGALPPDPFDVSTQVLDPDGANGIFRSADPEAPLVANDLSGATHVIGWSGLFAPDPGAGGLRPVAQPETRAGPPGCDEFALCLKNGRFRVDVLGASGFPGGVVASSDDTGLFFFSDAGQTDAYVTMINACAINDHFWVFAAATTNVEYTLTVTDTATESTNTYARDFEMAPAEAILDTSAFATCP